VYCTDILLLLIARRRTKSSSISSPKLDCSSSTRVLVGHHRNIRAGGTAANGLMLPNTSPIGPQSSVVKGTESCDVHGTATDTSYSSSFFSSDLCLGVFGCACCFTDGIINLTPRCATSRGQYSRSKPFSVRMHSLAIAGRHCRDCFLGGEMECGECQYIHFVARNALQCTNDGVIELL
jgi:hypothetical protein